MKKKYITYFGNPESRFRSQYGFLTFREWCERECKRIGEGTYIDTNPLGYIAIAKP